MVLIPEAPGELWNLYFPSTPEVLSHQKKLSLKLLSRLFWPRLPACGTVVSGWLIPCDKAGTQKPATDTLPPGPGCSLQTGLPALAHPAFRPCTFLTELLPQGPCLSAPLGSWGAGTPGSFRLCGS